MHFEGGGRLEPREGGAQRKALSFHCAVWGVHGMFAARLGQDEDTSNVNPELVEEIKKAVSRRGLSLGKDMGKATHSTWSGNPLESKLAVWRAYSPALTMTSPMPWQHARIRMLVWRGGDRRQPRPLPRVQQRVRLKPAWPCRRAVLECGVAMNSSLHFESGGRGMHLTAGLPPLAAQPSRGRRLHS